MNDFFYKSSHSNFVHPSALVCLKINLSDAYILLSHTGVHFFKEISLINTVTSVAES